MVMKTKLPEITLRNGLRVINYSSPHPFIFDDGSELPACSPERAREASLTPTEQVVRDENGIQTIALGFEMSPQMMVELWRLQQDTNTNTVILLPLPVLTALKELWGKEAVVDSPFRAVRMADRVNKIVCSDKFCV